MNRALLAGALLIAAVLVATGAGTGGGTPIAPIADLAFGGSHAICVVTGILAGIYLLSGNVLGAVGATVAAWSGGCFG